MRNVEIRKLEISELLKKLDELRRELMNLRLVVNYENKSPHKQKQIRRLIAKMLTILKEKQIKGEG